MIGVSYFLHLRFDCLATEYDIGGAKFSGFCRGGYRIVSLDAEMLPVVGKMKLEVI